MNKKVLIIGMGALLLLTTVLGITFAAWILTRTQTDENVLLTGCFDITFTENSSEINIDNTFPMIDSDGLMQEPFTFTLENTCDLNAAYKINLEVLSTTTLSHSLIKGVIDNNVPSVMTDLDVMTATISNATSYNLDIDYLKPGESKTHNLKVWVDETGTLANSQNKNIRAKIVISAEPIDEIPKYTDSVLAGSDPVLDSKMIPVNITDTGVVTVADTINPWYNYTNSEWANAVIVDPGFTTLDPGTTIPMESIEQMYVWIPRYQYDPYSIESAAHAIDITFVDKTKVAHPAFTFGVAELSGMWVGKFEQGEDNTIKPNQNSMHDMNVSTLYDNINNAMSTYSLDSATDVHMMKNTEWGAVAYLSQSKYGVCNNDGTCSTKVENNNYYNNTTAYDIVTGCGGNDTSIANNTTGIEICPVENRWETTKGIKASTTHNITGVYDVAGGRWEYVMGNMKTNSGVFYSSNAGFISVPNSKYYDSYTYRSSNTVYTSELYGDATVELNPSSSLMSNWNGDFAYFVYMNNPWFMRGGLSSVGSGAGIWIFGSTSGAVASYISARAVSVFAQ